MLLQVEFQKTLETAKMTLETTYKTCLPNN